MPDPLTHDIIGAAIAVHRHLGPGLLESAYQTCLAAELRYRGLDFQEQVALAVDYRSVRVEAAYRMDFVVGERVVVELKAVSEVTPVHRAQMLTYLRLSGRPRGLLLNFHTALLRDGIERFALDPASAE